MLLKLILIQSANVNGRHSVCHSYFGRSAARAEKKCVTEVLMRWLIAEIVDPAPRREIHVGVAHLMFLVNCSNKGRAEYRVRKRTGKSWPINVTSRERMNLSLENAAVRNFSSAVSSFYSHATTIALSYNRIVHIPRVAWTFCFLSHFMLQKYAHLERLQFESIKICLQYQEPLTKNRRHLTYVPLSDVFNLNHTSTSKVCIRKDRYQISDR